MYPASSPLLGAAPANCHGFESHPRIICRGVDASYTPSTVAPVLTSDDATGSKNGPAPAITTRRPTATRSPLAYACAAPAVKTPGRSQPGNGSVRSCAPVASTRVLGWMVRGFRPVPSGGPISACTVNGTDGAGDAIAVPSLGSCRSVDSVVSPSPRRPDSSAQT